MLRRLFMAGLAIAASGSCLSGCSATPQNTAGIPSISSNPSSLSTTRALTTAGATLVDYGTDPRRWPRVSNANPDQPQLVGIPADLQSALAEIWHRAATGGSCSPRSAAISVGRWSSAGFALIEGSDCGVGGVAVLSNSGGSWHWIFGANGVPLCAGLAAAHVPADVWNGRGQAQPSCLDGSQMVAYAASPSDASWTTYQTYVNPGSHFKVDVPTALTSRVAIAPTGGGASGAVIGMNFFSADRNVELSVHSRNNVSGDSVQKLQAQAETGLTATGGRVTYAPVLPGGFVVSGVTADGFITYERDFVYSNVDYVMTWVYPTSMKAQLDPAVTHAFTTFVPGTNEKQ